MQDEEKNNQENKNNSYERFNRFKKKNESIDNLKVKLEDWSFLGLVLFWKENKIKIKIKYSRDILFYESFRSVNGSSYSFDS